MEGNMFKKGLVVGIVVLFSCISFSNSSGLNLKMRQDSIENEISYTSTGLINTNLYVDDDFDESTPGWNVTHFAEISDAINAASDGDSIFVYDGTYSVFTVNKRLDITGESISDTIVYANEVKIQAMWVNLTTFTFKGKTQNLDCVLYITANHVRVLNCNLFPTNSFNPLYGIDIRNCGYVTIKNCNILGFKYRGIQCMDAHHVYIENCTIYRSYIGIHIFWPKSKYIYINQSEIYNCGWDDHIMGAGIFFETRTFVNDCYIHDNMLGIDMDASSKNEIIGCNFSDNYIGIGSVALHARNNKIICNNFLNNDKAIYLTYRDYNNFICYNNFIGNGVNAHDAGNNMWDNGNLGNYWDDYTGEDNNGDGKGDTPHYIPGGGGNRDRYPRIAPFDVIRLAIDGPYFGLIDCPIELKGFVWGGSSPFSWYWDFGDTHTSDEQNPAHNYTSPGKYDVVLTVTDDEDNTATDNTYAWIQADNYPPYQPYIDGPTIGRAETSYSYTFTATDPEGVLIWYHINWGDDTNTGWFGPYDSGTAVTKSHTWSNEKTYTIKCKAKDPYEDISPEATLTVTMPRNRPYINTPFLNFLQQHPNLFPILRLLLQR